MRSYSASVSPSSRCRVRDGHAGTRASAAADSNSCNPSTEPVSGSTACSGWGMSPTTLPARLLTPAMSRAEPLKFVARRVAHDDLPVGLELVEHRVRRPVAAGLVLGRDGEPVAARAGARPHRAGVDHFELDLPADEAQRRVRQQRARQQARLAQHLEAVADAEHEPAVAGEALDLLHDRREARDRAHAQVVAVGEAARDDHRVDALQVVVAVPQQHRLPHALGRAQRVDVVAGAGEADDAELHCLDLVVLDQRVGQQLLAHLRQARRVLHVELHQPPDVDVAHALEAERRQRPLDGLALRVEDPGLGADQDPRPHGATRSSQAENGSPASCS